MKPDYSWDTTDGKFVRTFRGKGEPECVHSMKFIGDTVEDVVVEIE